VKAGAAGAFLNMVKFLRKRGHEIDIYTLRIARDIKEDLEKEFKVFISRYHFARLSTNIYAVDSYISFIPYLRCLQKVKQMIIDSHYDILFTSHHNYSTLLLFLLRHTEIPKIYYCYEPPRIYYEPPLLTETTIARSRLSKYLTLHMKYLDRAGAKCADLILCPSYYEREYIWRTYGIFAVTNYLGVDLEKHKRLNVPKENMILTVGVLQPHKAHDFVIRSLALIPKSKRPKFVIISSGYGPSQAYKEKIVKLAKQNDVNLEIMESYISDREFAELHSKARLFVIPYFMEPSIEPVAFAYELPIVAVKEGGAREVIINHETGILTDRDEKEFAEAIEFLLDHPDIAAEMGRKGREWVEKNFTWEKCAENLEKNFKKVLNRYRYRMHNL
jgi:glycosyltransferase involved in cell wall biosynthesis